ncbi:MAG: translation initiation factor IF-2 N-terminal domain-containing protein, partial [Planctomycetes bacterium]|nr:translation initiation factor IF-2 N-terminal domain-containing protein [Planctomycetota bacterium]
MPVRIYALAKELNLDSKELVEICRKAGIPGKGSALASLTDEEADRVKSYLSGDKKKTEAAPAKVGTPVRPQVSETYTRDDYIAPGHGGRIRVLEAGRKPAEKPKETIEAAETSAVTDEAPPEVSEDKPPKAPPEKPPKKREAVIKLAEAPELTQPLPKPAPDEPKAQKPDIRLPKDVITGHKAGQRGPLEHLTKSVEEAPKKPAEKKKGKSKTAASAAPAASEAPL